MLSQTVTSQPPATTPGRRGRPGRREPRFPNIVNVAVSREISDGLGRVCNSFQAGLGYTPSDIVRLALFEWLAARGALMAAPQPKGNTETVNGR